MKNHRGMTLIDMILTIVIVATAIPPLLIAYARLEERRLNLLPSSVATHLATDTMEGLVEGEEFDDVVDQVATAYAAPFNDYTSTVEVDYVDPLNLNISVDPVVTDIKRVKVTVMYTPTPRISASMTTVVTDAEGG
ncbi:MAG: hypothetical protein HY465_04810 [Deltaproteobacteria bacterium]|nr:hypothetical protein [Deltaproteobacteria bacterium]